MPRANRLNDVLRAGQHRSVNTGDPGEQPAAGWDKGVTKNTAAKERAQFANKMALKRERNARDAEPGMENQGLANPAVPWNTNQASPSEDEMPLVQVDPRAIEDLLSTYETQVSKNSTEWDAEKARAAQCEATRIESLKKYHAAQLKNSQNVIEQLKEIIKKQRMQYEDLQKKQLKQLEAAQKVGDEATSQKEEYSKEAEEKIKEAEARVALLEANNTQLQADLESKAEANDAARDAADLAHDVALKAAEAECNVKVQNIQEEFAAAKAKSAEELSAALESTKNQVEALLAQTAESTDKLNEQSRRGEQALNEQSRRGEEESNKKIQEIKKQFEGAIQKACDGLKQSLKAIENKKFELNPEPEPDEVLPVVPSASIP